jgi:hypothetical protein
VNDKFFSYYDLGFTYLGKTEPPIQTPPTIKSNQFIVGDDLGSDRFVSNQIRVEFSDIPFIKDIGLKAIWYLDLCYYPHFKHETNIFQNILDFTRISHGFGVTYPVSPILSIMIYFNAGNFNARHGDDPLTSGVSLTFNIL